MSRFSRRVFILLFVTAVSSAGTFGQALTWDQIRMKFDAANPSLRAGQIGIEESRAQEITAYLRPNPNLSVTGDQINPFNGGPSHSTFGNVLSTATISYLHERRHKRELRHESAQDSTNIAISGQADLERTLLFGLRQAFVQMSARKSGDCISEGKSFLLRPPAGRESGSV